MNNVTDPVVQSALRAALVGLYDANIMTTGDLRVQVERIRDHLNEALARIDVLAKEESDAEQIKASDPELRIDLVVRYQLRDDSGAIWARTPAAEQSFAALAEDGWLSATFESLPPGYTFTDKALKLIGVEPEGPDEKTRLTLSEIEMDDDGLISVDSVLPLVLKPLYALGLIYEVYSEGVTVGYRLTDLGRQVLAGPDSEDAEGEEGEEGPADYRDGFQLRFLITANSERGSEDDYILWPNEYFWQDAAWWAPFLHRMWTELLVTKHVKRGKYWGYHLTVGGQDFLDRLAATEQPETSK